MQFTPGRRAVTVVGALVITCAVIACTSFDAASEVSPPEAGAATDAAEDAASPADASPGFCASSDATFCVDFDDGGLEAKWSVLNQDGGGAEATVALDSLLARSKPSSMHMRLDPLAPGASGCDYARAIRRLTDLPPTANARFGFEIWLGASDPASTKPSPNVGVGSMATSTGCNIIANLGTSQCSLRVEDLIEAGTPSWVSSKNFDLPLTKKWTRVELVVSLATVPPTATYLVDGVSCGAPITLPSRCLGATTFTILPGLYCIQSNAGGVIEANIDNVEFRSE